jgi:hypothetical protein
MRTSKLLLDLLYVDSPHKFWVLLVERRDELERLNRLLSEASRVAQRAPAHAVLPGQVYLAPYRSDHHRGLYRFGNVCTGTGWYR